MQQSYKTEKINKIVFFFLFTAHRKWARNRNSSDIVNTNGKNVDENELSNISIKSFSSSDQNNKISDHSRYIMSIQINIGFTNSPICFILHLSITSYFL